MGFFSFTPVYRTVGGTKRRKNKAVGKRPASRPAAARGFGGMLAQLSSASSLLGSARRSVAR